jgi:hypothetical protein
MGFSISEEQAAYVSPPRRGEIIALTVDTTARAYDLSALSLAGFTPEGDSRMRAEVWLTLEADGADLYFQLSDGSSTALDPATVIAAGGALAYSNAYGAKLKDGIPKECRIDRSRDTHIVLRTSSGTATIRFWASSNPSG